MAGNAAGDKSTEENRDAVAATFADYVAIARPDHWFKHIFIVPGIVLAFILLEPTNIIEVLRGITVGFISAASIASANYAINEWLDAAFDAHHPTKSRRPAVVKKMSPVLVYLEYGLLAAFGLAAAWFVSDVFFVASAAFLLSGIIYNVKPIRSKDKAYLDVITESANNPIRLLLGWSMVDPNTLPPSSLLLTYWMGGAFLMVTKRLAEYRNIVSVHGVKVLHLYRSSFRSYTENRLLISAFLYAHLSAFFIAVFLIKYRIEYVLVFPMFSFLFSTYFHMSLKEESRAQTPEKLFKERNLIVLIFLLIGLLIVLTFVDIPLLSILSKPHYIDLKFR